MSQSTDLPASPDETLSAADAGAEIPDYVSGKGTIQIVHQLLDSRLHQSDIKRILQPLSETQRTDLMDEISSIMGKLAALIHISNQVSDTLSISVLLERIVTITTDVTKADRGTLFLHDGKCKQLYSKLAMGDLTQEIRIPEGAGIAGAVFTKGIPIRIDDAYADERFNKETDIKTGYKTDTILCVPIKTREGKTIGVIQLLNKESGAFIDEDAALLQAVGSQVSSALVNAQLFEEIQRARDEESRMLEVTDAISSELYLDPLLMKIMVVTTELLDAERSTLFLHDKKSGELWSKVAQGIGQSEIRFPSSLGIAGAAFTEGETINIPDAYVDERFNPEVDKKTGFKTTNILCMPVKNKAQQTLGAIQVLNKRGGSFTDMDEKRLRSFCSQASVAIENAMLFEEVENMRNYNESMFASMTNAVMTLDADAQIVRCNRALLDLFKLHEADVIGKEAQEYYSGKNAWVLGTIDRVNRSTRQDFVMDTEFTAPDGDVISVNLSVVPLRNIKNESLGTMLVFEDITEEKRVKGTMARYMAKEVLDQLLESGDNALGGRTLTGAVLFSDIRGFTQLSEELGAETTVNMLNRYFSIMVDVLNEHGGILDKYIGDAIMAVFGAPFSSGKDSDKAVRAGIDMMRGLCKFNQEWVAEGHHPIDIGIGINTDRVVSGNIGSMKRMDYTVIGDGVNLASRIEGLTKYYKARLMISEFTKQQLKGDYILRELDVVRVKGKDEPVSIYEVMDYHTEETFPHLIDALELYAKGLKAYRKQDWEKATTAFKQVLDLQPSDGASERFISRCEFYAKNKPSKNWDGVWTMESK